MLIPPAADVPDTWPCVLDIDLDAIAANWRSLQPGPIAAVVKADGYGLGARRVAARLHREGARHFFVAHPDEALAIRNVVPGAMVAVLNGLWPGHAPMFAANGITPVLGSLNEIDEWTTHASSLNRALPALLHVDTGMNRLGLTSQDLDVLDADPHRLEGLEILYVMTHLVSAECPEDGTNALQAERFTTARARLPAAPFSFANSSGLFLGPAFHSDLGRPGAALYGINPQPGQPNPMRPVVRLRARVLQIRDVPTGGSVGYNAQWTAARPSRIAVISVGYADGFHRSLSGHATAYFDDKPVPLVGRVSMDLSTFDVTDLPGLQYGDWLDLIGPHMTLDQLAASAGTNGYEILTSLGRRYPRTYR